MDFLGNTHVGRAFGISVEDAINKAFSESCESICRTRLSISERSGLAVHTSPRDAIDHAIDECIERDAFMCHFLTKTPFLITSPDKINQKPGWSRTLKILHSIGGTCRLFEMHGIRGKRVFGAIVLPMEHREFCVSVGLSAGESEESSLMKSLLESLRNIAPLIDKKVVPDFIIESYFNKLRVPTPKDHRKLCNDNNYARKLKSTLNFTSERTIVNQMIFDPEFVLNVLQIDAIDPIFDGLSLYFAHAQSNQIQNMFFGLTKEENINLSRLSQFKNTLVKYSDIEKTPHPIG